MDNYEKLSKHLSECHNKILKEEFNIYDLDFIKSTLEKILIDVNDIINKKKTTNNSENILIQCDQDPKECGLNIDGVCQIHFHKCSNQ